MSNRITEALVAELRARAKVGLRKYGVSVSDNPLSTAQWLQHAKEEALDLATYLERLIEIETVRGIRARDGHAPITVRVRLGSGDVVRRQVQTVAEAVAELPWPIAVSWEVETTEGLW